MKTKHTPGPWLAYYGSSEELVTIIDSQNEDICELAPFVDDYSEEEMNANAKLMAAAPEMLEALNAIMNYKRIFKGFLDSMKDEQADGGSPFELIENAIKKAT